jgi:hypothetical protein
MSNTSATNTVLTPSLSESAQKAHTKIKETLGKQFVPIEQARQSLFTILSDTELL